VGLGREGGGREGGWRWVVLTAGAASRDGLKLLETKRSNRAEEGERRRERGDAAPC